MKRVRFAALLLGFSLWLPLAGCDSGPAEGKVSGTVTINGQPAEDVYLTFEPQPMGRASTGVTMDDGQYTLEFSRHEKGALVGPHIVRIRAFKEFGDEASQYLPPKYNAKANENPDLQVEVKKGDNVFDFVVEVEGGRQPMSEGP